MAIAVAFAVLLATGLGACGSAPSTTSVTAPSTVDAAPSLLPTPAPTRTPPVPTASVTPASTPTPTSHSVDPNYSGFETIAFGTGGTKWTLDKIASTFAPGDPIRVNAEYTPSLPAGTVVTVDLARDGSEVAGYPQIVAFKTATRCIFGSISPGTLPAGHYHMNIVPDAAVPAIGGDFVTK
jgi:hypothetical protein